MKNITIVATASVALIKLENLIKKLKKEGFHVEVIATPFALEYFDDLQKLVTVDINQYLKGPTQHINIAKNTDLYVVAPATANTISKFIAGFADNMALSSLLAADQKILFAPAMNDKMLEGIIERKHIAWLENKGHYVIGPNYGMLKEGYKGWGRMSEPGEIVLAIKNITLENTNNKKILVSYGGSKEYIDPIRYVGNNASGKFGKLIIKHLKLLGLKVDGIDAAQHSHQEIFNKAKKYDVYIANAALSDFTFKKSAEKLKKKAEFNIVGIPTLDVIEKLAQETNVKIIGFKADKYKENAVKKMNKLGLEFMVWNKLNTMDSNKINGAIIFNNKEIILEDMDKFQAAQLIANLIKEKLT